MSFGLSSQFEPRGDQQQAIDRLVLSLEAGNRHQTLLGVTGSGKTFTAANVVAAASPGPAMMRQSNRMLVQLCSRTIRRPKGDRSLHKRKSFPCSG